MTLGDLTVNAAKSATFTYLSTTMTADDGGITSITMGDIALTAGENADIYAYQYFSADDYIGDITIGDVTLTAGPESVCDLVPDILW